MRCQSLGCEGSAHSQSGSDAGSRRCYGRQRLREAKQRRASSAFRWLAGKDGDRRCVAECALNGRLGGEQRHQMLWDRAGRRQRRGNAVRQAQAEAQGTCLRSGERVDLEPEARHSVGL